MDRSCRHIDFNGNKWSYSIQCLLDSSLDLEKEGIQRISAWSLLVAITVYHAATTLPAFPHCTGNFQASFTFNIPYIEVTKYLTCLIQVLVYVCCDSIASLSLFSFHSPRVLVLADKLILQLHDLQVLGSMVS